MGRSFVVVLDGHQPACVLRLAETHFPSPPFYSFATASTILSFLEKERDQKKTGAKLRFASGFIFQPISETRLRARIWIRFFSGWGYSPRGAPQLGQNFELLILPQTGQTCPSSGAVASAVSASSRLACSSVIFS